jgi:RNA polymerase sigma factor (sigma-70 family)
MGAISRSNRELLAAARRGDAAAADALACGLADLAWTACRHVTANGADAEAAFGDVMTALRADGFARLKGYDGRASVEIYAALAVRDLLSERAIKLLAIDGERGWRAFEAFFGPDIQRMLTRMLPGAGNQQNREDGYQSVCEAMVRNEFQRLRAYSGRGSPSGFVLRTIENLIIDFVRTIIPRRRLPAAIERLAELDQAVFRLICWNRFEADAALLAQRLACAGNAPPSAAEVAGAIDRVRRALPRGYYQEPRGDEQATSLSAVDDVTVASGAEDFAVRTPEENLIESQTHGLLDGALDVLQQALPKLAAGERLYLQLALTGRPAREIARITGCPVEEIHKVAQKLKRRLREEMGEDAAVKKWLLSV